MSESKKRLYKRSTVERKLSELVARIDEVNSESERTKDFVYYVSKLIVFGSFLDVRKDMIHDLDIAVELVLKEQLRGLDKRIIADARCHTMPKSLRGDLVAEYIWPEEEVLRFLKKSVWDLLLSFIAIRKGINIRLQS